MINTILSGVVAGIISSVLFNVLNHGNKPKIFISKKIAVSNTDGREEYRFKIINKSRCSIKNLKVFAQLEQKIVTQDASMIKSFPVKVARKDMNFIEPYNKKDKDMKYAV